MWKLLAFRKKLENYRLMGIGYMTFTDGFRKSLSIVNTTLKLNLRDNANHWSDLVPAFDAVYLVELTDDMNFWNGDFSWFMAATQFNGNFGDAM